MRARTSPRGTNPLPLVAGDPSPALRARLSDYGYVLLISNGVQSARWTSPNPTCLLTPAAGRAGRTAAMTWRAGCASAHCGRRSASPTPTCRRIRRICGFSRSTMWTAPVLVEGLGARDAPLRYLCAVEALTREKLQADAGYSGLITKNPTHPLWRTLYGPCLAYELGELAEYLPDLEKYRPQRRKPQEVDIGRNVSLFDDLRQWAYRQVRAYRGGGLAGWNAWLSLVNITALLRNADFPQPLGRARGLACGQVRRQVDLPAFRLGGQRPQVQPAAGASGSAGCQSSKGKNHGD